MAIRWLSLRFDSLPECLVFLWRRASHGNTDFMAGDVRGEYRGLHYLSTCRALRHFLGYGRSGRRVNDEFEQVMLLMAFQP